MEAELVQPACSNLMSARAYHGDWNAATGIVLLVTLALLPWLAQAQRIGPLGPPAREQSRAQSADRAAATAQPATEPSAARSGRSTAVGTRRLAAFATAGGPAAHHRHPPSVATGVGLAELLWRDRQDDRRGSVAGDPDRASLALEDHLPQRSRDASSLPGLRHRSRQTVALIGGWAGPPTLYRLGLVRRRKLLERHRFW